MVGIIFIFFFSSNLLLSARLESREKKLSLAKNHRKCKRIMELYMNKAFSSRIAFAKSI